MTNAQLASHVLQELRSYGVEEFCLCPSSRNAPFLASLKANASHLKAHFFFEERSMAFFALGRIRSIGRPVAVLTTSGTAAGELLPAAMEAYYSGLPLILVTSDRPRHYRGSGAPQAAEQVGLFGVYVSRCIDLEGSERVQLNSWSADLPIHLNVCFDEPLLEAESGAVNPYQFSPDLKVCTPPLCPEVSVTLMKEFLEKTRNPVAVVGLLAPHEREAVAQLLLEWRVPVYLEGLSGLREDERLASLRIHIADRWMERASFADYPLDGVVRLGGVPTLRFWRDLEAKFSHLSVLSLSRLPFSGLGRPSSLVQGPLRDLCLKLQSVLSEVGNSGSSRSSRRWLELDREANRSLRNLLRTEPTSEPGMMAALSELLPARSRIYIGNSLPIREWDLAATHESRNYEVWGSRGLNGIDGQVSTFLGFADKKTENWAIMGDLTALYDLPGPWILSQMPEVLVRLVVMNNGGGKIFSRMFPHPEFQNCHQLRFKGWAELWKLPYEEWKEIPQSLSERRESFAQQMIEVLPDEEATRRFWKKFAEISNS